MRRSSALFMGGGSIVLPAIGDSFMGGYYAGIIDTTKGNIIAADAHQTGARYALIVSPKSLQTVGLTWGDTTAPVAGAKTRWEGLAASTALAAVSNDAAAYCLGLTYPSDGGSAWYLPAMDEFELLYRHFKPTTNATATITASSTFPGSQPLGTNPSSDPAGASYATAAPTQTTVTAFRSGGLEALDNAFYPTSTDDSTTQFWQQSTGNGNQNLAAKTTATRLRPVRRLLL